MSIKNKKNTGKENKYCTKGSVTVETSITLFLFLLFFVCLIQFYMILNLEISMQSALEQTADAQAAYAAIVNYHDEDGSLSYIQCGLNYAFAKSNIIRLLGKKYLDESWIKGGSSGIHFEKSKFLKDGENIELVVYYKIKIPVFSLPEINVVQRAKRRIWMGADSSDLKKKQNTTNKVYITPSGTAYHLYSDCNYINVKLQSVSANKLTVLRNKDGAIYYACESCHPEKNGMVYITTYGNRYHSSEYCKAIEKNVMEVDEASIGNRHICSKCLKRAG